MKQRYLTILLSMFLSMVNVALETPLPCFGETPFLELEPVYFDTASAEARQEDLVGLSVIANFLREMPADVGLWVEGHTDERGLAEANMALGWKRAEAVKSYLVHMGGDPAQIHTDSYGEERPADPRHYDGA